MRKIATFVILAAFAANASAAGFRLSEQDAKANGMGNAFVAVADNPSAAWYNPAAITGLEGANFSVGSVMVSPTMEHLNRNGSTDAIEHKTHIPPHLYITRRLDDRFAMGISVNAPFGLSTEWDMQDASTRLIATKSDVKAIYTNLNGVYKVNEKLSVAAGASYVQLDATLNKMKTTLTQTMEQTLEGDGDGVGYNAAAMYRTGKWQFGANYRSQVKVNVEGQLNYRLEGALASFSMNNRPAKTAITLPDTFQLGAAYRKNETWLFSAEADYTNWTTYRRLDIEFLPNGGRWEVSSDYKYWKSVWAFRLGTECRLNENWKARAGAFYDMNPVKEQRFETRVPDSDRLALSFGGGYAKGNLTVDASYTYLKFMTRTVNSSASDDALGTEPLDGKYYASAMLPAITVGYKF